MYRRNLVFRDKGERKNPTQFPTGLVEFCWFFLWQRMEKIHIISIIEFGGFEFGGVVWQEDSESIHPGFGTIIPYETSTEHTIGNRPHEPSKWSLGSLPLSQIELRFKGNSESCYAQGRQHITIERSNPLLMVQKSCNHQLRLVIYPIVYKDFIHRRWCRISETSRARICIFPFFFSHHPTWTRGTFRKRARMLRRIKDALACMAGFFQGGFS